MTAMHARWEMSAGPAVARGRPPNAMTTTHARTMDVTRTPVASINPTHPHAATETHAPAATSAMLESAPAQQLRVTTMKRVPLTRVIQKEGVFSDPSTQEHLVTTETHAL